MKSPYITRRKLLGDGCKIGTAAIMLSPIGLAGTADAESGGLPDLSNRSVINLNSPSEFDYAFHNHFLGGDGSCGPFSSGFSKGPTWPALIDANGWPNQVAANGVPFGGSIRVPDP